MGAILMHRNGGYSTFVRHSDLDALLAELDGRDDPEHPEVAIIHESGWGLSAFPSGRLTWENIEEDGADPGHRFAQNRSEARRLFELVALGHVQQIHALHWEPGYGT